MAKEIITLQDLFDFESRLKEELSKLTLNDSEGNKYLQSKDVKSLLGISHGKLQTLRNNGTIPFSLVDGTIIYKMEDIEEMIESRMVRKNK